MNKNLNLDSLIHLLQNTVIYTKKSFEDELDGLMGSLSIKKYNSDDEWDVLSENYSKLNYLFELINFYEIPSKDKFNECLEIFLKEIDRINQFYLKEINWENDPNIDFEGTEIEFLLRKSLNLNNQIEKLKTIVDAYKLFVPIVADIRNQEIVNEIKDEEFLQVFKKRKLK